MTTRASFLATGLLLVFALLTAAPSAQANYESELQLLRDGANFIDRGSGDEKVVALTFDDGPHPKYTYRILRILNYYDARGTFFVVGTEAERYPKWVKMANQLGNEIGSHTYDHFRLQLLSEKEASNQIRKNQQLIKDLVGYKPLFLRPPGGGVGPSTSKLVDEFGMVIAWWTYNTNDLGDLGSEELYQNVVDNVEPGSIVLMHDGSEATVEALPRILETLKERGYSFVTMSELYSKTGKTKESLLANRGLLSREVSYE